MPMTNPSRVPFVDLGVVVEGGEVVGVDVDCSLRCLMMHGGLAAVVVALFLSLCGGSPVLWKLFLHHLSPRHR